MKKFSLLLALTAAALCSPVRAYITDINLPDKEDVIRIKSRFLFQLFFSEKLDNIIKDALAETADKDFRNRISSLTAEEAKPLFTTAVINRLEKDHHLTNQEIESRRSELLNKIFSETYFGNHENKKNPPYITLMDPIGYLQNDLRNSLRSRSINDWPKALTIMLNRVPAEYRLLSPNAVREWFSDNEINQYFEKRSKHNSSETREQFDAAVADLFSYKYFGIPENPDEKKEFFLKSDFYFLTPDLVKNIYNAAQRIMNLSTKGDVLVSFGNSPYFLGRALKHLASDNITDENYRQIIFFPFSGSPNRTRQSSFPNPKDIVTIERLNHLKNRLVQEGLSSTNTALTKDTKVLFMDVVGSGAGPAYVMEQIIRDFQKASKALPDVRLLTMNLINPDTKDSSNNNDSRNLEITHSFGTKDNEQLTFGFPSIHENTHFKVDGQVIHVPGHTALDMIRNDQLRVLPEYNPCYWNKEYDYLLEGINDDSKKPHHIQVLFNYFDTHIKSLIEKSTAAQTSSETTTTTTIAQEKKTQKTQRPSPQDDVDD